MDKGTAEDAFIANIGNDWASAYPHTMGMAEVQSITTDSGELEWAEEVLSRTCPVSFALTL